MTALTYKGEALDILWKEWREHKGFKYYMLPKLSISTGREIAKVILWLNAIHLSLYSREERNLKNIRSDQSWQHDNFNSKKLRQPEQALQVNKNAATSSKTVKF